MVEILKIQLQKKGIKISKLSKITGIKYELLRRVFHKERKLTADEFVLILEKTGIKYDNFIKQNNGLPGRANR